MVSKDIADGYHYFSIISQTAMLDSTNAYDCPVYFSLIHSDELDFPCLVPNAGTVLEILGLDSSRVVVFGLGYCLGSEVFLFRPFGP